MKQKINGENTTGNYFGVNLHKTYDADVISCKTYSADISITLFISKLTVDTCKFFHNFPDVKQDNSENENE